VADRVVFASFYTPDYYHWAQTLDISLNALGLPSMFLKRASLGDWSKNIAAKPRAILELMGMCSGYEYMCFLDADSVVCSYPKLLFAIDADLAASVWRPSLQFPPEPTCGTVLLRLCDKTRDVVASWVRRTERSKSPTRRDQIALRDEIMSNAGISFVALPPTYNDMSYGWWGDSPVIVGRRCGSLNSYSPKLLELARNEMDGWKSKRFRGLHIPTDVIRNALAAGIRPRI